MTAHRLLALTGMALTLLAAPMGAQTPNQRPTTQIQRTRTPSDASPAPSRSGAPKAPQPRAVTSTTISETLQNIVISPGKSLRVFFSSDFSGAERASISVYADPTISLGNLRLAIWWAVAGAPVYGVQDVITGSDFYYSNVGGGNVPVYGSSLFIDVINDSNTVLPIQNLAVYAVAR